MGPGLLAPGRIDDADRETYRDVDEDAADDRVGDRGVERGYSSAVVTTAADNMKTPRPAASIRYSGQ
jgi:hypothetical protein